MTPQSEHLNSAHSFMIWFMSCFCILFAFDTHAASGRKRASNKRLTWKLQLLEKGNREPIEGAGIFNKAYRQSAYTNQYGKATLRLPRGKHTIIIKAIGYKSGKRTISISPTTKPTTIYIEVDPNSSLQSIVKAKRARKSSQQFSASNDLIQSAPGVLGGDPFRFFQNLPGVARAARTSGALVVRGADFADTGFFIDGHRIPILYHFGAGLSIISRRFLNGIDFFPGGAPLRFGRITAGVISAKSRTPRSTSVHGEAYISIANAGLYLEIPIGTHWSISAAASRSYIDAFYSLITKDPLVGAFWDYQLKIAYQSRHHQFSAFLFGSDDYYDYAGISEGNPEVPLIGRDKIVRALRFLRLILKYSYQKGPLTFRTSLATGFTQNLSDTTLQTEETWDFPIELRIDTSLRLQKQVWLEFGLDGVWNMQNYRFRIPTTETAGFPTPSNDTLTQNGEGQRALLDPGLYLGVRWRLKKLVDLRLGVRADFTLFQGRWFPMLDPRLNATIQLHKRLRALVSVGLYHRPPTPTEWSEERGNPELKPPQALQTAAGLEFTYKRDINIRAQFYYSQMFNLVVPSNAINNINGTLTPERFNNNGFGRSYGLELLMRFRLLKRLYGWVAYTLSRSERGQAPNNDVYRLYEFDQPHILNLWLRWQIGDGWSISTRFRLATGNPTPTLQRVVYDADTDSYRPVFDGNDKERLPLFHQLDLRVDKVWTFNTWKLGFYLDILNVYNAKVAEEYRFTYNFKTRQPVSGLPFFPAFGIRGEF